MKKFILTLTAISAIALSQTYAQTGNASGGSNSNSTPTGSGSQTRDQKNNSGNNANSNEKRKTTNTGGSSDANNLTTISTEDLKCCADIYYKDSRKGLILIAENPMEAKNEGKRIDVKITDSANKMVATSRYKLMRNKEGDIVIVPNSMTGKEYKVTVSVKETKESKIFQISL